MDHIDCQFHGQSNQDIFSKFKNFTGRWNSIWNVFYNTKRCMKSLLYGIANESTRSILKRKWKYAKENGESNKSHCGCFEWNVYNVFKNRNKELENISNKQLTLVVVTKTIIVLNFIFLLYVNAICLYIRRQVPTSNHMIGTVLGKKEVLFFSSRGRILNVLWRNILELNSS